MDGIQFIFVHRSIRVILCQCDLLLSSGVIIAQHWYCVSPAGLSLSWSKDTAMPLMTHNSKTSSTSEVCTSSDRTILNASDYDDERHVDHLDLEKADKSRDSSLHDASRSISASKDATRDGRTVVSFTANDPEHPHNLSRATKLYIVMVGIILVLNSTMGSSLPSGSAEQTRQYFHVQGDEKLVLLNSIYLVGYVLGPLIFSPLSESFGRKVVLVGTFTVFTLFMLGCALAPTYAGLIVFRLLVGIGASTPISVVGGLYADIYSDPQARGMAITVFMVATTWGPIAGPVASGYLAVYSWRWTYWFGLIFAGASWPFLLFMPETYAPTILRRRAKKLRKEHQSLDFVAPAELEKQDMRELVVVVLTRPLRMLFGEAIVLTTSEQGLTFLPIGVGAMFAGFIYLWWNSYLDRAKNRPQPASWTRQEEYRRLPLACLGGPLFVVALFWLGWTARPSIHWIVPTLSAVPFGLAFLLIFMGELNYIVDAYEEYAASAFGAASCSRSVFGVVLPFAAEPMYTTLGVGWACSLLAFISLAMCVTPFVFIKYGDRIRASSKFCRELKEKKESVAIAAAAAAAAEASDKSSVQAHAVHHDRTNVRPVSDDVEKGV
nr:polyamine transporter 3 [Quercus suber]